MSSRRHDPGKMAFFQCVALALAVLTAPGSRAVCASEADDAARQAIWRRPENDGLNCLFLQLRWLGHTAPYEEYLRVAAARPGLNRMDGLADAARALGYELVPARLTMAELERMPMPVIVHLEREDRDTGFFALVAGVQRDDKGEHVVLIHGGTVTVDPVPRDTFRKEWGGYALVPPRESGWMHWARRGTAALMVALAAVTAGSLLFKSK